MNYYTKELNIDNKWDVEFEYYFTPEDHHNLYFTSMSVAADTICVLEHDYLESQIKNWLAQEIAVNYDKYLEDEILVDSDKKLKYSKENEE